MINIIISTLPLDSNIQFNDFNSIFMEFEKKSTIPKRILKMILILLSRLKLTNEQIESIQQISTNQINFLEEFLKSQQIRARTRKEIENFPMNSINIEISIIEYLENCHFAEDYARLYRVLYKVFTENKSIININLGRKVIFILISSMRFFPVVFLSSVLDLLSFILTTKQHISSFESQNGFYFVEKLFDEFESHILDKKYLSITCSFLNLVYKLEKYLRNSPDEISVEKTDLLSLTRQIIILNLITHFQKIKLIQKVGFSCLSLCNCFDNNENATLYNHIVKHPSLFKIQSIYKKILLIFLQNKSFLTDHWKDHDVQELFPFLEHFKSYFKFRNISQLFAQFLSFVSKSISLDSFIDKFEYFLFELLKEHPNNTIILLNILPEIRYQLITNPNSFFLPKTLEMLNFFLLSAQYKEARTTQNNNSNSIQTYIHHHLLQIAYSLFSKFDFQFSTISLILNIVKVVLSQNKDVDSVLSQSLDIIFLSTQTQFNSKLVNHKNPNLVELLVEIFEQKLGNDSHKNPNFIPTIEKMLDIFSRLLTSPNFSSISSSVLEPLIFRMISSDLEINSIFKKSLTCLFLIYEKQFSQQEIPTGFSQKTGEIIRVLDRYLENHLKSTENINDFYLPFLLYKSTLKISPNNYQFWINSSQIIINTEIIPNQIVEIYADLLSILAQNNSEDSKFTSKIIPFISHFFSSKMSYVSALNHILGAILFLIGNEDFGRIALFFSQKEFIQKIITETKKSVENELVDSILNKIIQIIEKTNPDSILMIFPEIKERIHENFDLQIKFFSLLRKIQCLSDQTDQWDVIVSTIQQISYTDPKYEQMRIFILGFILSQSRFLEQNPNFEFFHKISSFAFPFIFDIVQNKEVILEQNSIELIFLSLSILNTLLELNNQTGHNKSSVVSDIKTFCNKQHLEALFFGAKDYIRNEDIQKEILKLILYIPNSIQMKDFPKFISLFISSKSKDIILLVFRFVVLFSGLKPLDVFGEVQDYFEPNLILNEQETSSKSQWLNLLFLLSEKVVVFQDDFDIVGNFFQIISFFINWFIKETNGNYPSEDVQKIIGYVAYQKLDLPSFVLPFLQNQSDSNFAIKCSDLILCLFQNSNTFKTRFINKNLFKSLVLQMHHFQEEVLSEKLMEIFGMIIKDDFDLDSFLDRNDLEMIVEIIMKFKNSFLIQKNGIKFLDNFQKRNQNQNLKIN
ncbi:hypothetical protein M0811_09204 [Anaeramoeba ignava]|uniref:Uncharacterized protein n=1 Tax=Anaeramoeba ignava TaxID=1746090 RepID=A0A9Q0LJJ6_ANAIG|nr:hypothetical protein M0811_09204 [Anaeramoeba ignava]